MRIESNGGKLARKLDGDKDYPKRNKRLVEINSRYVEKIKNSDLRSPVGGKGVTFLDKIIRGSPKQHILLSNLPLNLQFDSPRARSIKRSDFDMENSNKNNDSRPNSPGRKFPPTK